MRTFDIYTHDTLYPEAIKQGFSWPAFIFGWIWAVSEDLNFPVAGLLVASVTLIGLQMYFEEARPFVSMAFGLTGIAFQVWVGRNGNRWRTANLRKSDYIFVTSVLASSPKSALASLGGPATPAS